jgi:hypothetical protein
MEVIMRNRVSVLKRYRKLIILGLIATLIIVCYISATFADTPTGKVYDITVNYDPPKIIVNQNGYSELQLKRSGAGSYLTVATAGYGAPMLPVDSMILYLKEGETIKNVTVTGQTNQTVMLGKDLQYIVPSQKSDALTSTNAGAPDPAIYSSANLYPGVAFGKNIVQYYRGYRLAFIPVHPVQYNPAGKLIQSAVTLSFRVETTIQPGVVPQNKIKPKKSHEQEIRNMIDNKDALNDSFPEKISKIFANSYSQAYADTTPYQYVIIGPKAFESACQGLLNLRISQGFSGTYLPVETIFSSYSGVDPQEKIRTCLIDYCNNHDTEYVLLVGDTDLVPIRPIMVSVDPNFKKKTNLGKEVYSSAPSDLYYSSLDGTFNFDNDDVWGEVTDGDGGGPIDMFPDLCIGRIPAGNIREVNRHIWKIMQFELQTQSNNVLCIGEKLSDVDWGSDYLDTVYNNTLSSVSGYSQTQLQDKTATYTDVDVVNAFNSNTHELIFNHQHANPWGVAKLWWGHFANVSGVAQVTNTHPFFFFSGGCSTNCFKEYDSISEYYTAKSLNGAYAYIGHTSSGRFQQSMDYLQLIVSKSLAATSSNARREKCLGQLLNKAKMDIANGHTGDFNSYSDYRELHYNLNLLGDPLSPMIKTGFADLPTNSNILPNVQESTNIRITAPDEEKVIAQGQAVTINATNTDSAVTVTSVIFYYQELKGTAGFQTLNTDTAAPYSYTWNSPPVGDYLLKVEAFNGTTKVGEDTRFFRVAQEVKPVITDIRFPAENPEYRVGQPIFVCAKATDSDGWIEGISYEFKYNDGSATPITETPRINVFPHIGVISAKQPKDSSTHTLEATAKAYDNHGFESAISTKISFSFNVVEYNPPTISIIAPTNGQKLNIKEKVDISIQVDDPKNWKDEDGGIGNLNVKVKRLLDGNVQDLGTKYDLGKSATPAFDFTPTVASDYTITASVTDYDGITKETSVTVKVINPNAPLSFENPSKPWSAVSTNVTLDTDTNLKTEGDSSLVLKGTNYMEFQSAVFSSADIDYYSNELSLDVYVPTPLTDSYIGMIQLYFTAPGAYKNHEWVTQVDMKDLKPGQWNTVTFTLPAWVVDILKGNYNDLVLGMTLNTNQTGYFRLDNLRFTGSLVVK